VRPTLPPKSSATGKLLKAEERKKHSAEGNPAESKNEKPSILAGVSTAMPSLLEAYKLSSRAAQAGFDWPMSKACSTSCTKRPTNSASNSKNFRLPDRGPKVAAWPDQDDASPRRSSSSTGRRSRRSVFRSRQHARYLSLDPESALRKTNRKFKRRFQWMEARLHESGRTADQAPVEELESLWQQAKREEGCGA